MLPLYVESLGMEALHVGILLATFAIMFSLLQFPSGVLSDRLNRLMPITAGLCLSIVSLVMIPSLGTFAMLAVAMAIYGTAYALIFPSISALIAEHTAVDELGTATGIFHALLTAGVAIGALVMGWTAQVTGIKIGLALSAMIPVIALIIAQIDLRRRPQSL